MNTFCVIVWITLNLFLLIVNFDNLIVIYRRNQKMIYFFTSFVLINILFYFNKDEIIKYNIINSYNILDKALTNIIIYYSAAAFIVILWYILFMACFNITSIKFKDAEISIEEAKEIKNKTITDKRNIKFLTGVINTRNRLIMQMSTYVDNLSEYSSMMYINLIKEYLKNRGIYKYKLKNLNYFYINNTGYNKIQQKYNLTDYELANIKTHFDNNKKRCCIYYLKHKKDIYLIKIHTMYTEDDIVFEFDNKRILQDEHKIIQGIISILDLYVEQYQKSIL